MELAAPPEWSRAIQLAAMAPTSSAQVQRQEDLRCRMAAATRTAAAAIASGSTGIMSYRQNQYEP